ncbi:hypothetical protein QOT17_003599 [Balamuthia mandrillaris]
MFKLRSVLSKSVSCFVFTSVYVVTMLRITTAVPKLQPLGSTRLLSTAYRRGALTSWSFSGASQSSLYHTSSPLNKDKGQQKKPKKEEPTKDKGGKKKDVGDDEPAGGGKTNQEDKGGKKKGK